MNEDSLTSKTTGKRFWGKILLIVLALLLGAGITLFSRRPNLWSSFRASVAGALSLDKPAAAVGFTAVATDNLNIRSGSDNSCGVVSSVPKGASVELLGKPTASTQWVQVKTSDGKTGWCLKKYLDLNGQDGSSSSKTQSIVSSAPPASSATGTDSKAKQPAAPALVSLKDAAAPLSIQVSIANQNVTVYDAKNRIVAQFICSTGEKGSDTPTGTFTISDRGESFYNPDPSVNEGAYYWTRFYGEYLFHSVPFDKHYKLEPEEAAKLGTPASHGCVRLAISNAKWIYDHIPRGTKVTVK